MIENIVVESSPWTQRDLEILFESEPVQFVQDQDLSQLMKELGIFKSTSEARRANRTGAIPGGYTEYRASKKQMIWIWNPTE
jgi:arginine repressor